MACRGACSHECERCGYFQLDTRPLVLSLEFSTRNSGFPPGKCRIRSTVSDEETKSDENMLTSGAGEAWRHRPRFLVEEKRLAVGTCTSEPGLDRRCRPPPLAPV